MFNQQLFKKPKDVRYVDMAIWIDNNFYNEDCDYDKAYTYMWLLAYMLACKAKYFNSKSEYEEFASLLAYSTYQRMINKDKVKIKSVLNYMKSIMYFRKAMFDSQRHQEIINPDYDNWDASSFKERYRSILEKSNRDRLISDVLDILKETSSVIKSNIPKTYKSNKVLYKNIYISCLLSMINNLTLPTKLESYLEDKLKRYPSFNEAKYYKKHLDNEIILWHLHDNMKTIIRMILNKTNKYLINEIKDISDDFKVSDNEFNDIVSSVFVAGGKNNETD